MSQRSAAGFLAQVILFSWIFIVTLPNIITKYRQKYYNKIEPDYWAILVVDLIRIKLDHTYITVSLFKSSSIEQYLIFGYIKHIYVYTRVSIFEMQHRRRSSLSVLNFRECSSREETSNASATGWQPVGIEGIRTRRREYELRVPFLSCLEFTSYVANGTLIPCLEMQLSKTFRSDPRTLLTSRQASSFMNFWSTVRGGVRIHTKLSNIIFVRLCFQCFV